MAKYNLIAKHKGYMIDLGTAMATTISQSKFEKLKELNPTTFDGYDFIPYKETDFNWWYRISRYLTPRKILGGYSFECDLNGNITKY